MTLMILGKKVEEANLTLADFEVHKRRLTGENSDLLRQLQVCLTLVCVQLWVSSKFCHTNDFLKLATDALSE